MMHLRLLRATFAGTTEHVSKQISKQIVVVGSGVLNNLAESRSLCAVWKGGIWSTDHAPQGPSPHCTLCDRSSRVCSTHGDGGGDWQV